MTLVPFRDSTLIDSGGNNDRTWSNDGDCVGVFLDNALIKAAFLGVFSTNTVPIDCASINTDNITFRRTSRSSQQI